MNKKNLFLITLLALAAVSCGGGGSNGGTTASSAPVANVAAGNTPSNAPAAEPGSNVGAPSASAPAVAQVTPATNPSSYYTVAPSSPAAPSAAPASSPSYKRIIPGFTTGGVNSKFMSDGKTIQWNGSFAYDKNNVENNHNTQYTGKGVKIGVMDVGFQKPASGEAYDYWQETKDSINNIERIENGANSTLDKWGQRQIHGLSVVKTIASRKYGVAKDVQIYAVDGSNPVSGSDYKANDFKALVDKGVDIITSSQASDGPVAYANGPKVLASSYPVLRDAVNNGKLVVLPAGNKQKSFSTPEGSAPYYNPELEKGWLNVVGLYYPDGHTSEDFDLNNLVPSNGAGAAANWTVTALGVKTVDYWGQDFKVQGSSFATPYVAGVAALIKEKYPFMDGSLLRQTILSTATDIGDPGVDDVYGWGLLNVDKALNGPALFEKRLALGDYVEIKLDGGNYVFDNDIAGDAGLDLSGTGTLTLNQNAEYTGGTKIGSGAYLKLRKDMKSPMSIGAQGTVELLGANAASIQNNGGTLVNSGISSVGKLSASKDSTTVIDIAGRIDTSSADLNGNLVLTNNSSEYFTKNGKSVELITGNVKSNVNVVVPDLVNAKMTNGIADIARKDTVEYAKEAGADAQQLNTAQQVEASLLATDNDYENGTLTSKQAKSAASLQSLGLTSLDTLSGQIYASAQALTFEQSETVNRVLSDRISSLDNALDSDSRYGFWMDGFYSKGQIEKDGYAKGKTKSNGGIAGFDTKLSDSTVIGASIDYSNAKVKFNRFNGESKSDLAGISAYARTNFGDSYAAGRIGYSDISSRVQREISTNISHWETADINHHDKMFSAYAELGHDFKKGDAKLTPYAGLSYDRLTRGSFEEDASYGLKADKKNYNMTSVTAGLKAKHTLRSKGGLKTTFSAYASYTKGLGNGKLDYEAKYNNSNGEFKVRGIDMSRDKAWAGAGVEKEVTKNFGVHANYDYKISTGHKKEHNNVISTGFRIQF